MFRFWNRFSELKPTNLIHDGKSESGCLRGFFDDDNDPWAGHVHLWRMPPWTRNATQGYDPMPWLRLQDHVQEEDETSDRLRRTLKSETSSLSYVIRLCKNLRTIWIKIVIELTSFVFFQSFLGLTSKEHDFLIKRVLLDC